MDTSLPLTSSCRHCRYYAHEGRRGGHCSQLNVPVQSSWHACSLAVPIFLPALRPVAGIKVWSTSALDVPDPVEVDYPVTPASIVEIESALLAEKKTA